MALSRAKHLYLLSKTSHINDAVTTAPHLATASKNKCIKKGVSTSQGRTPLKVNRQSPVCTRKRLLFKGVEAIRRELNNNQCGNLPGPMEPTCSEQELPSEGVAPVSKKTKAQQKENISDQTVADAERVCPLCSKGTRPNQNAKKCVLCCRAVHVLVGCSEPVSGSKDWFNPMRVCISCCKISTVVRPSREMRKVQKTVDYKYDDAEEDNIALFANDSDDDCDDLAWKPHCSADALSSSSDEEEAAGAATLLSKAPRKKSDLNETVAELSCPACNLGNKPDPNGAHKCAICSKAVHALVGCSVSAPGSEEGFGQTRVCMSCSITNSGDAICESPNVGGQVQAPQSPQLAPLLEYADNEHDSDGADEVIQPVKRTLKERRSEAQDKRNRGEEYMTLKGETPKKIPETCS